MCASMRACVRACVHLCVHVFAVAVAIQLSFIRDADFPFFTFFSVIFGPISAFSFLTFHLFLYSFSVRRHAHIDFQLCWQKSSGIPDLSMVVRK